MMKSLTLCRRVATLSLVSMALLCGCGDDSRQLPKSPVVGTVSYEKEFPQGEVIFKHSSGEITVAKFAADGEYEAEVPQGVNHVIVRSQTSSLAGNSRPGAQMEVFTNHIPVRYAEFATSKLEYTVKEGENDFDIKLVD